MVPFLLVVPPLVGLFIGRYLDNRFDKDPLFTIVLLVLGFIAGARETAKLVKRANKEDESNEK